MPENPTTDPLLLRLGGVCATVGGLGFLAVAAAHGDLPSATVETTLRYVADRPMWSAIHLGGIVCVLLWVAATAALASSLPTPRSAALGRLALVAMAIGATLFIVDYSIDGYALKRVADTWAASSGADADSSRAVGEAVVAILRGTVTATVTWAFGLPFLLAGIAVGSGRGYPRWAGWVAVVTGGAGLLGGIGTYLGTGEAAFLLALAGGAASSLWLAAMGVLMWRRAATLPAPSQATSAR